MTTSSKMNWWRRSCIIAHCELPPSLLIDTTNNDSPAVSKKKCSGTSKSIKERWWWTQTNLLVSFCHHHLLLFHVLHPQKSTQLSIQVGCCFSCVFLSFFTFFYLIVVCGCYSQNYTFFDFQMVLNVGCCMFYCCIISFVKVSTPIEKCVVHSKKHRHT